VRCGREGKTAGRIESVGVEAERKRKGGRTKMEEEEEGELRRLQCGRCEWWWCFSTFWCGRREEEAAEDERA
jgi:hypothetical protein